MCVRVHGVGKWVCMRPGVWTYIFEHMRMGPDDLMLGTDLWAEMTWNQIL